MRPTRCFRTRKSASCTTSTVLQVLTRPTQPRTAAAPVRAALEQSGLWSYFRGLLSAVEQGRAPLDPELYEKAVRRLRTARRATVIFTAREEALRAAKRAGFQVVLVGPDHSVEASSLADVTVSDYRDMIHVEH